MNLIELQHALRQLRLGGIATVLETRLHQAQAESMPPIDLISCLVADELTRRGDRLLERRRKQAAFRDPQKTLDQAAVGFDSRERYHVFVDYFVDHNPGKSGLPARHLPPPPGPLRPDRRPNVKEVALLHLAHGDTYFLVETADPDEILAGHVAELETLPAA